MKSETPIQNVATEARYPFGSFNYVDIENHDRL